VARVALDPMSDAERRRGIDRRSNWQSATTGTGTTSAQPMPNPAPTTPSEAHAPLDRAALWAMLDGIEQTINELYVHRKVFSGWTVHRLLRQIQQAKATIQPGRG
jgi:hypothetical protein